MDLFNYDYVIIILYVLSLKSQFRQKFVEINYIYLGLIYQLSTKISMIVDLF